ncbi:MAG: hypothetical protein BGN88_07910 [Clostridiales bacterium 43-6]|nr:MAG: hypothetical protein BGN88_07910 [Clostridiales bacterium 43-6]
MKDYRIFCLIFICFLLFSGCKTTVPKSVVSVMNGTSTTQSLDDNGEETTEGFTTESVNSLAETKAQSTSVSGSQTGIPLHSLTSTVSTTARIEQPKELRAMWIPYYELNFNDKSEAFFKTQINTMFENTKNDGYNAVFVHIRAYSDAFYPSKYFPWAKQLSGTQGKDPGFNPMQIMIAAAHSKGLLFYAWLNPFRVSTSSIDYTTLAETNPARVFATDKDKSNDDWTLISGNGIYYNPAVPEIQKLIINGVREIVNGYDVDGIYFDDYFYPTTDESFDKAAYQRYLATKPSNPLSLGDWRRTQINAFVSGTYRAIKTAKPYVHFGISPQANMDTNYNKLYADVKHWVENNGYVDSIMPQLYFGFEYNKIIANQSFNFNDLLTYWSKLKNNKNVKLYIALGIYKSGQTDNGSDEWINKTDIIQRQVALCRTVDNYSGFSMYSYSYFISTNKTNAEERNHLLTIMK